MPSCFIVGSSRSATTALSAALKLSGQAVCLSEPMPNVNEESRWKYEGFLHNPYEVLARDVGPRMAKGLDRAPVYIEKQVSLVPFMRELHALYGARFIIPYRDGRDVVTSMINWHRNLFPIIYREAADAAPVSEAACQVDANVRAAGNYDPFDYSLPRPVKGDPYRDQWPLFSQFEMCCWYWNAIHDRIFEEVAELPAESYMFVNSDDLSAETMAKVYAFCGLTDYDAERVQALLGRGINSLAERGQQAGDFPRWREWDEARLMRYYDLCWRNHRRLGLADGPVRPVPASFGEFWKNKGVDEAWYQEIFEYRRPSHEAFRAWVENQQKPLALSSAMEIGVGTSDFYREKVFGDWEFIGIDLLPPVADWLNARATPRQRFFATDITTNPPEGVSADLVYSHASVDNVPDVNAFLASAAAMTRKVLFISNYRGYFPELKNHRFLFDVNTNIAFNDISPKALRQTMTELGFKTIAIVPCETGRSDIAVETVLIAARDEVAVGDLLRGLPIGRVFAPYQATTDAIAPQALINQINQSCFYYSDAENGLAGDLADFVGVLRDLKQLRRPLLNVRDFAGQRQDASAPIGLRVDIDDDLVAAMAMAQVAKAEQVSLTFYLLPTAPYYGGFKDGVFHRNDAVATFARHIQDLGHEVGLHVDAFHYYAEHGVDGSQAVETELNWLREQGLRITTFTGHNCASYYGAENIEVFRQYAYSDRALLDRDGLYCPLGTLDATALGLACEGSFFVPPGGVCDGSDPFVTGTGQRDYVTSASWMRKYLMDNNYLVYGTPVNIWVAGRKRWLMSQVDAQGRNFTHDVTWETIAAALAKMAPAPALMVLHPNYFGRRHDAGQTPYEANGSAIRLPAFAGATR